jgi:hypothetical protein
MRDRVIVRPHRRRNGGVTLLVEDIVHVDIGRLHLHLSKPGDRTRDRLSGHRLWDLLLDLVMTIWAFVHKLPIAVGIVILNANKPNLVIFLQPFKVWRQHKHTCNCFFIGAHNFFKMNTL